MLIVVVTAEICNAELVIGMIVICSGIIVVVVIVVAVVLLMVVMEGVLTPTSLPSLFFLSSSCPFLLKF